MKRRHFIRRIALGAAGLAGANHYVSARPPGRTPERRQGPGDFIDAHVYVSRWPYRRIRDDETPQLVEKLAHYGVTSAWTASFDALLHRDIAAVNIRLAEECARQDRVRLIPFGAVNPTLPDWEEDLRRCQELHGMPGIRLHPDFHGYTLEDTCFLRLLDLATRRGLVLQISLGMDDPRHQPPLAVLPPTSPEPLLESLLAFPDARVMLLNYWRSFGGNRVLLARLAGLPQISLDIATLEAVGRLDALYQTFGPLRLVFGSYAPFFNFGAAWRKLQDESSLPLEYLAAIKYAQAREILPGA